MNIRDRRALFAAADDTLSRDGAALRRLVVLYLAITTGLSLIASVLTIVLSDRIASTGGLSNMGLRSILSTAQTVLPLVQAVVLTGLQLGHTRAVLDARRGRFFSRDTLFGGFRRVIPMLCASILQGFLYAALGLLCLYLATYIFLFLPASHDFQALIMPLFESASVLNQQIMLDEATMAAATEAVMPALWIFAAVYIPVLLPTCYRYRMTMFRLIDHPRPRPLLAMRESRFMMHRNRFALLKLDFNLWWYYLLQVLVLLVGYGDSFLVLFGVTLPWSAEVSYILFLVLSLALQAALLYVTMNRVSLIYAAAYECLLSDFEDMKAKLRANMNIPAEAPKNPWQDQY